MEALLKNLFYEAFALEALEALRLFSGTDEARSNTKFFLNRGSNATFTRSVKLSEDKPAEWDRFLKFAGLIKSISSGGGVDN